MLSQADIRNLIDAGEVRWNGGLRGDALLGTLGGPLQELRPSAAPIDPMDEQSLDGLYEAPICTWSAYVLDPGRLVLAQLRESLVLGPRHLGYIAGLSHVARLGLQVHLASPWIEPGFGRDSARGHLVLELVNHSRAPLILRSGMPAVKIKLFTVAASDGVAGDRQFYGRLSDLKSRYAAEFGSAEGTKESPP